MGPQRYLDLEDSKPIFSHDTLAHDDAPLYEARLSGSEDIDWTKPRNPDTRMTRVISVYILYPPKLRYEGYHNRKTYSVFPNKQFCVKHDSNHRDVVGGGWVDGMYCGDRTVGELVRWLVF